MTEQRELQVYTAIRFRLKADGSRSSVGIQWRQSVDEPAALPEGVKLLLPAMRAVKAEDWRRRPHISQWPMLLGHEGDPTLTPKETEKAERMGAEIKALILAEWSELREERPPDVVVEN
jgi:hypothetical protein